MGEISQRKTDHIRLALHQEPPPAPDPRFFYEPLLGHQDWERLDLSVDFLDKTMRAPLWVSSMTGGGEQSQIANQRLARAVGRFGLGMGLGSLRPLLDENPTSLADYDVRSLMGPQCPLLGNIGIAQAHHLLREGRTQHLLDILEQLQCDGLIVHLNPLQEWYQPGGDLLQRTPLEILQEFLPHIPLPVVVKEVGQGMGPTA